MAKEKYQKPVRGQVLNRSQAAIFFGIAPTAIDQWVQAGCPYISKAKVGLSGWEFDSAALVDWHVERLIKQAESSHTRENVTLEQAKTRKTEAEASIAELNLKKLLGELVDIQEVMQAGMSSYMDCKAVLLNIPSRLASKILTCQTPEQSRQMLEAEVIKALKSIADYEPEPDERNSDDADPSLEGSPPPPGKADSKRVGRQKPTTLKRGKR